MKFHIEGLESYEFEKYFRYKVKFDVGFPIGHLEGTVILKDKLEFNKEYELIVLEKND